MLGDKALIRKRPISFGHKDPKCVKERRDPVFVEIVTLDTNNSQDTAKVNFIFTLLTT